MNSKTIISVLQNLPVLLVFFESELNVSVENQPSFHKQGMIHGKMFFWMIFLVIFQNVWSKQIQPKPLLIENEKLSDRNEVITLKRQKRKFDTDFFPIAADIAVKLIHKGSSMGNPWGWAILPSG